MEQEGVKMTVQCEEFEYCKVKVRYVAPPELVAEKRDEAIANIKKNKVKIPGFRPGKATNAAICAKFGKQIGDMVKRELVSEAYEETLFETKMKPIFYPEIHDHLLDGNNFSCDMTFLKKPDFELKQYKGFSIPKPHVGHSAAEVAEKIIQNLRTQHSDPIPYDENDFVQPGDQVTLDVTASGVDGVMESLTKLGALYTIGQNPIAEIDEKMYGMKAGEERDFDIIFADNEEYAPEVRGKRVKFHVKIHMGTKRTPLPLDDALAQKVGLKTYAELCQAAAQSANTQLEQYTQQQLVNQLTMRILSEHDFEVPSWHIVMESQRFAAGQNVAWDSLTNEQIDNLNAQSKDKIKLSLILDSIRENEPEATYSDQEMVNKIRAQLESQGQNAVEILSRLSKDGSLVGAVAALKDASTIQWLISKSEIVE
jgi:trigger factor